ncbi:hypothetical protein [Amycolatopsis benzoatilytica]|uniref:hypothetical protein n=1 Tax=Amycolatopsis benzoatilytica TaxID=346045 RepID=UPI000374AB01|nr:hypothetical protein [Amycolatopsis benzoatilytica]
MSTDKWSREHSGMLAYSKRWQAEISNLLAGAEAVSVELHPGSEPAEQTSWDWFLWIEVGSAEFQALLAYDTKTAAFEDDAGLFDDYVKFDQVSEYIARRLT